MSDSSDREMDKPASEARTLSETEEQDNAYWLSKTPLERLQALESIRQMVYGYDPAATRIDKTVFEVVHLKDLK